MEFYTKLPRNKKEFVLFMAIISIISVNIIAPLITCFEIGFSLNSWVYVLQVIPFIWICVIAIVLITYKPAGFMTSKILKQEDSFNAHIIVNILCTVLMMSIVLTVVGTWIGNRQVSMDIVNTFFYSWPRNFAISLGVEMLIAQPIARFVMTRLHRAKDLKLELSKA